jgi:hypothetical protein
MCYYFSTAMSPLNLSLPHSLLLLPWFSIIPSTSFLLLSKQWYGGDAPGHLSLHCTCQSGRQRALHRHHHQWESMITCWCDVLLFLNCSVSSQSLSSSLYYCPVSLIPSLSYTHFPYYCIFFVISNFCPLLTNSLLPVKYSLVLPLWLSLSLRCPDYLSFPLFIFYCIISFCSFVYSHTLLPVKHSLFLPVFLSVSQSCLLPHHI